MAHQERKQYWQQQVTEWHTSGLSDMPFCKQETLTNITPAGKRFHSASRHVHQLWKRLDNDFVSANALLAPDERQDLLVLRQKLASDNNRLSALPMVTG
ncbi:IS66 family insertion sequence element accessory protein TnpA [Vreelandella salicampi]|uniref:Uncharacterized protein n=1 Tax=Vreelandella salicampi TaxID=1449798 RepID=A0A7Z0LND6_9GAMM|nr:hypothetical protein [Halomonas salicampi]NYS62089.1 hypothetical protein [Halomonas salicampi]